MIDDDIRKFENYKKIIKDLMEYSKDLEKKLEKKDERIEVLEEIFNDSCMMLEEYTAQNELNWKKYFYEKYGLDGNNK